MRKMLSSMLLLCTFALGSLISCKPNTSDNNEPIVTEISRSTNYNYLVELDGTPDIKVSGSEFQMVTNNCGSRVSAIESQSRSREFRITLDAEFSELVRGQLGGDILIAGAEVEAAVGVKLGIQIGGAETIRAERQIETPTNSITIVTLKWEEIWQTGNAIVMREDGTVVGDVPFRVLTTMRLSQTGVQELSCGTLSPTVAETSDEASLPFDDLNTPIPTFTFTPSPIPTATNTPKPTATYAPKPTTAPVSITGAIIGALQNDGTISTKTDNVVLFPKTLIDAAGALHGDFEKRITSPINKQTAIAEFYGMEPGTYIVCFTAPSIQWTVGEIVIEQGVIKRENYRWPPTVPIGHSCDL